MINSNQELLDSTFKAFVIEKKPFGYDRVRDCCTYRGADGTACAIGLHLPDSAWFEDDGGNGFSAKGVKEQKPELWTKGFSDEVNTDFADEIQNAHDRAARLAIRSGSEDSAVRISLTRELIEIAHTHALTPPTTL